MPISLKLIAYFIGNALGLIISAYYLPGFILTNDLKQIAILALLLVLGNIFIKPILRLVFSPIIFLTIGLFTIVINASILYTVDFISDYITINGTSALIYGTLIISAANLLTRWSARLFIKENTQIQQP